MKTYFSNLIPQILSYSKKLDSSSILTKHHWTVIDEANSEKTVFIFRHKDNQLLISRNGNVEKGTWELIDHNTLLIDTKTESRIFKHGFADDSVLALKVDGKTEYAFLIDENIVPESVKSIDGLAIYLKEKYLNLELKKIKEQSNHRAPEINENDSKNDIENSNYPEYENESKVRAIMLTIVFFAILATLIIYFRSKQ